MKFAILYALMTTLGFVACIFGIFVAKDFNTFLLGMLIFMVGLSTLEVLNKMNKINK